MEQGGLALHPSVLDEGTDLARRSVIRAARRALEENAASEAIRQTVETRSQPMKDFKPETLCLFQQTYRHPGATSSDQRH